MLDEPFGFGERQPIGMVRLLSTEPRSQVDIRERGVVERHTGEHRN